MAHNIAMINGKPAMMFVGQSPWHGLGKKFTTPPTSAKKVICAAGLDWQVVKKPVYAFEGSRFCAIPHYHATFREDLWGTEGCEPFGLVGEDYQILQNAEAFSFFDPIIESGEISYETAGALGRGERVWVLARVKGDIMVGGQDRVERFLLLSNGHDGHTALQIRFTPVRVVCQNTLSWALSSGKDLLKSHHGRGMHNRVEDAQAKVKSILNYYNDLAGHFDRFVSCNLSKEKLTNYINLVFPAPPRKANQTDRSHREAIARNDSLRTTSAWLFETGMGNERPGIRGTLWAAYNGVTELVDHHLAYRDRWHRLDSIWFSEGQRTKMRAFDEALTLSKN